MTVLVHEVLHRKHAKVAVDEVSGMIHAFVFAYNEFAITFGAFFSGVAALLP